MLERGEDLPLGRGSAASTSVGVHAALDQLDRDPLLELPVGALREVDGAHAAAADLAQDARSAPIPGPPAAGRRSAVVRRPTAIGPTSLMNPPGRSWAATRPLDVARSRSRSAGAARASRYACADPRRSGARAPHRNSAVEPLPASRRSSRPGRPPSIASYSQARAKRPVALDRRRATRCTPPRSPAVVSPPKNRSSTTARLARVERREPVERVVQSDQVHRRADRSGSRASAERDPLAPRRRAWRRGAVARVVDQDRAASSRAATPRNCARLRQSTLRWSISRR